MMWTIKEFKSKIKRKRSITFLFILCNLIFRRSRISISANKLRDFDDTGDDDALRSKERLCTPHIGRNKLGTIFNERIVVSPVPFTVSTRESFSTLKTIPIKFMNENLEIPSYQGKWHPVISISIMINNALILTLTKIIDILESARNIDFQSSARKSGALRNPNIHAAWQAPVSPTVWPKNIRLAPIDTSRLPNSNKNGCALITIKTILLNKGI